MTRSGRSKAKRAQRRARRRSAGQQSGGGTRVERAVGDVDPSPAASKDGQGESRIAHQSNFGRVFVSFWSFFTMMLACLIYGVTTVALMLLFGSDQMRMYLVVPVIVQPLTMIGVLNWIYFVKAR